MLWMDVVFILCIASLLFAMGAIAVTFSKAAGKPQLRHAFSEFHAPEEEKVTFNVFERRSFSRLNTEELVECRDLARVVYSGTPFEAKLVDVSPVGCRILANAEIPPTALLYLKQPEKGRRPQLAFVAYCRNLGVGYQAGLEFLPQH